MKIPATIGSVSHGISQSSRKSLLAAAMATPMPQILEVANTDIQVASLEHTATELANVGVLIAGGENEAGEVSDSEILDHETQTHSSTADSMHTERMRLALMVLPNGKVKVIAGGHGRTMEMFNLKSMLEFLEHGALGFA